MFRVYHKKQCRLRVTSPLKTINDIYLLSQVLNTDVSICVEVC